MPNDETLLVRNINGQGMVTECDGGFPLLVFQLDLHLEPLAILFGDPHLDIQLFKVLVFTFKIKEVELLTPFDWQD